MTPKTRPSAAMLLRLSREDERVISLGVSESIAGFHAQQSIEKALKAVLTHWGLPYAFTHNISELVSQINKTGTVLPDTPFDPANLMDYATTLRYEDEPDGRDFDLASVQETVAIILKFAERTISSE